MPINALADAMGMPLWFVGGVLGLILIYITLALSARFLHAKGSMLSAILIVLLFVNMALFTWPFWVILIVGATVLWQVGIPTLTLRLNLERLKSLRPGQ